ncbi:hypothetical protein Taro_012397 [Colocasia esculenta]|uniref:Uncharacterized protein n=1 Tax=Colocasia esculenta TaxID=4460 RepID=A0A843UIZ3_COLES|nr:hypothetical protein [Colocasia esculenta]
MLLLGMDQPYFHRHISQVGSRDPIIVIIT